MKYYKDAAGNVYAYEQSDIETVGLVTGLEGQLDVLQQWLNDTPEPPLLEEEEDDGTVVEDKYSEARAEYKQKQDEAEAIQSQLDNILPVFFDIRDKLKLLTELTGAELDAHLTPEISLEEARAEKLRQIDAETSAAIVAGFDYEVDGEILHFAYGTNDQQNFSDTANMVNFSLKGIPGVPESIPWNGWRIEKDESGAEVSRSLVRLDLDANAFLALYMQGAMMHKAGLMELGGQRKAQVDATTTIEELEGI